MGLNVMPLGVLCAAAALTLSACRSITGSCHDPAAYQQAEEAPPLQIPAGLEAPDTRNALRIPALKEPPPPPRKEGEPCLDAPPKFSVPRKAPAEA